MRFVRTKLLPPLPLRLRSRLHPRNQPIIQIHSRQIRRKLDRRPPTSDLSDDSDSDDDLTLTTSPSSTPSSALKKGNKHLGYLTTELASRYQRLDQLQLAAEKLNLVRALMTHKGGRSQVVQAKAKKDSLAEAVMKGKMTSNGLALPGNESEDDEEEATGGAKKRLYKFSKERKR